jgi:hypothetical protein
MWFRRIAALAALIGLTGCAGAGFNPAAFQTDLVDGRVEDALARLESFDEEDVSALLDRGLLLQLAGRYRESNAEFEKAERLIAALYTRSLGDEALSLLTNDLALAYRASGFEHAYIAYYRAWNYLSLGRKDDVLVEARRIGERLSFRSRSCPDQDGACGHDPFLRYFSGLLFEWGGEFNDAYVAYKQADLAAATARERYGVRIPSDLGRRLVRLAGDLGFEDEAELYAEAYEVETDPGSAGDSCEVLVFWENGIIGLRQSVSLVIPIFKGERDKINDDIDGWSETLSHRAYTPYERKKLDYLLRVSLPEYVPLPPVARGAEMQLGGKAADTRITVDLSAMAADALDQAMGGILTRAIARSLVKYLATEVAEDQLGQGAGILVNLIGAALEHSDTRSWRSLPFEIQFTSLNLPAGSHDGTLVAWGADGEAVEEAGFEGIEARPGEILFLRHRTGPEPAGIQAQSTSPEER